MVVFEEVNKKISGEGVKIYLLEMQLKRVDKRLIIYEKLPAPGQNAVHDAG